MGASGTNRRILFVQRPSGMVTDDCFEIVEEPVPEPGNGDAVMKVEYLSLDPAMRGWMRDEPSYLPPIGIGDVMRSGGVGTIVSSRSDALPVGTKMSGLVGWQDYVRVGGASGTLAQPLPDDVDLLDAVSVYGSTGLTAYFGVFDVGKPKEGETFVVSGAAGAVGSAAGQIAKIAGCRVVGIAGTDEKCAWIVDELGFDAWVNYKTEDVEKALAAACPDGIDVYFDNVGGDILNAALALMNQNGRIVACGMISQYNAIERPPGPSNIFRVVSQRLRMEGFIVLDYFGRFPEGAAQLAQWVGEGKLKHRVTLVDGLLEAPHALNQLFTGENIGKLVVKV